MSPLLIAMATLLRMATGTWLNPGSLFSLWWCFAGILPLILAPYDPVSPAAVASVAVACASVCLGVVAGNGGFRTVRTTEVPTPAPRLEKQLWSLALVITLILALVSNIAAAKQAGLSPKALLDANALIRSASEQYAVRFAVGEPPPSEGRLAQAFLPFVYLAAAVGGICFNVRREWRWKFLSLFTLVPAAIVTLVQTTKAAFLFSLSFWLATYFATLLRRGRIKVFTKGHLIIGGLAGLVLAFFLLGVGFARMGSTDAALLSVVLGKLIGAALGHMSVFSRWLADYWSAPVDPSLGGVTFSGPLELMGLSKRVIGLFENPLELVTGESSNIFTAFRPLIQDYTIPGAIAVLAAFGFVGGVAFRSVARGKWIGVPVLAIVYATIMWTPITWLWVYNSLTAAMIALLMLVVGVRALWLSRARRVRYQRIQFSRKKEREDISLPLNTDYS